MAYWIIKNDPKPNHSEGDDLNGLQIQQTLDGDKVTGYQLIDPTGPKLLAATNQTAPPIEFDHVPFKGYWHLNIASPPQAGVNVYGVWHKDKSLSATGGQDGDFTAMAGSGAGAGEGDAASSAKA
jgi:hypothetical protein